MVERNLDMSYLIFAWQDDAPDNLYYLDVRTGDVRLVNRNLSDLRDLTDEIEKNRERFKYLPKPDRGELISDLKDFMNTVQDVGLKGILSIAFESPHPLSAFRKILEKKPEEVARLNDFRNEKVEKRIEQWLAANAIAKVIVIDDDEEFFDEDEEQTDFSV